MAVVPARIIGMVIRAAARRVKLAVHYFVTTLDEELGVLGKETWDSIANFLSMDVAIPIDGDGTYPAGRLALYMTTVVGLYRLCTYKWLPPA